MYNYILDFQEIHEMQFVIRKNKNYFKLKEKR